MNRLMRDFLYGTRMMARRPAFTAVAVLALALGIGANTAMFSVVNTVLLRPLPYAEPDRLVALEWSYFNLHRWRGQQRSMEAVSAVNPFSMSLSTRDEPERISCGRVNAGFFRLLRVRPAMGRDFLQEEDTPGGPRVAILTDNLWKRRFAADPNVVGRSITLDGELYTVIGVLPDTFRFDVMRDSPAPDLYAPLALSGANKDEAPWVRAYGRLKPGVSLEQANAEMGTIWARLQAGVPRNRQGRGAAIVPIRRSIFWDVRHSLLVLLGAVTLVLLIACANVANLLLSRATARRKEMAVRAAMGAGRRRLIGQLLMENLPLGLAGGALGLLFAYCGVPLMRMVPPDQVPMVNEIRVDATVLAFTAAVSVFTIVLFGMAPAFSTSRVDVNETLKEGARGGADVRGGRLRRILVVSEVALALLLTVGATLMIRSFLRLQAVNPGFNPDGLLSASISLPLQKYREPRQRVAFFERILDRVQSMPGVQSATLASELPLSGVVNAGGWVVQGRPFHGPRDVLFLFWRVTDRNYLRTMQIPLRRGRWFNEHDTLESPKVAVISEGAARRYFPNEDAIGKRIGDGRVWITVIGIVADVRHEDVGREHKTEILFPYTQDPARNVTLAVRTDSRIYPDPQRFAPALRHAVAEIDRDQAVSKVISMPRLMNDRLAMRRLAVILLVTFAALALVLAAVGIYGVLAFAVTQRTHEIGVRMALGAGRADVLRMVVRQATGLALAGVALGLVAAVALTRVLRSMLYGVSTTDPAIFAGVAVLLMAVAAVAGYIPARRASRLDPIAALRYE